MEQKKRNLKNISIVVLIFVAISLANIVRGIVMTDFSAAQIPEGSSENLVLFAKIFIIGISLLLLAPNIYIGVKGLKLAKKPNSAAKAHIIWGIILLVFSVFAVIAPIQSLVNKGDIIDNILSLLSAILDVIVFFEYVRCAKALTKQG